MQKEIPTTQPETEVETTPGVDAEEVVTETEEGKTDPLDTDDIDTLRSEAKKFRGIASRKERKDTEPTEPKKESEYITREELYAENRTTAIKMATEYSEGDPMADIKKEIDENWQDIMTHYVSKSGQKKPEDILEDIYDAHAAWKRRGGGSTPDDSARELQHTTVNKPGGSPKTDTTPSIDEDPRYQKPKKPDNWYPTQDSE